jgi:tuftelin-interacting protein 11
MMDFAVTSPHGMAAYRPSRPQTTPQMAETIRQRQETSTPAATSIPTNANINFKQLIAKKADESGILFMPVPNKTYDGKQVYQFGKQRVYIDRSVVFVFHSNSNQWSPISIQSLIDSA